MQKTSISVYLHTAWFKANCYQYNLDINLCVNRCLLILCTSSDKTSMKSDKDMVTVALTILLQTFPFVVVTASSCHSRNLISSSANCCKNWPKYTSRTCTLQSSHSRSMHGRLWCFHAHSSGMGHMVMAETSSMRLK